MLFLVLPIIKRANFMYFRLEVDAYHQVKTSVMGRPRKRKLSNGLSPDSSRSKSLEESDFLQRTACNTTVPLPTSDCYDILVSGENSSVSPSSWLSSEYFFYSSPCLDDSSAMDSMKIHELEENIHRQQKQLNEIKNQLGLALDKCSQDHGANTEPTFSHKIFAAARTRCDPLEQICHILLHPKHTPKKRFVCRSALKLANMDALLDFKLVSIKTEHMNESKLTRQRPFVFVDLCGAPGGFSEYILYRLSCNYYNQLDPTICKGFGMSLSGSNADGVGLTWDMKHISSIHPAAHRCFHIVNGSDGTGDIYNWNNVKFLSNEIRQSLTTDAISDPVTLEDGIVDLVVCDGGFELQRDSQFQEDITNKLVLNQVAAGLAMLKPGGNLCVKMFGFQTSISRNIILRMQQCFDLVAILKPIISRPASAERYVVGMHCKGGFAADVERWREFVLSTSSTFVPKVDLTHFFLSFEYDLLLLNVKACNNILTELKHERTEIQLRHCTRKTIMAKRYIKYWKL